MQPDTVWTPEKIEEVFSGTGLGNKTIGQTIKELQLEPDLVYQRLKRAGIEAQEGDRIKELANEHNTTPINILTVVLIKDSRID
jgi:hypothetical protein